MSSCQSPLSPPPKKNNMLKPRSLNADNRCCCFIHFGQQCPERTIDITHVFLQLRPVELARAGAWRVPVGWKPRSGGVPPNCAGRGSSRYPACRALHLRRVGLRTYRFHQRTICFRKQTPGTNLYRFGATNGLLFSLRKLMPCLRCFPVVILTATFQCMQCLFCTGWISRLDIGEKWISGVANHGSRYKLNLE